METLTKLAVKHPYYCHTANYYSNDAGRLWETMTEFLDEFDDADIDMNLCFRFDIHPRGDSGANSGRYKAEVFLMHQRKGIFSPHVIKHVNEQEAQRFLKYAQRHWEMLKEMWEPISTIEEPTT